MRWLAVCIVMALLTSCSEGRRRGMAMERAVMPYAAVEKPDTGAMKPVEGEAVRPVFVDGRARNLVHKNDDQAVYLMFDAREGELLRGHLYSKDSTANIRFSQIFLPDGTTDGPFSRDITYRLPQSGTYKLAVHENMMAGEPWQGEFRVELTLK